VAISTSAPLVVASGADPLAIAAWRVGFMFLAVAAASALWTRGRGLAVAPREAATLLGLGVVLGAHFGLWIVSVRATTVAASVVLVTAHPLMVAVASHMLLKERLEPRTAAGILVAFAGVVVLVGTDFGTPAHLYGDLLAVGGAVSLGAYLLVGRLKRRAGLPVLVYTTYVYGGAAAALLSTGLVANAPLYPQPQDEVVLFLLMALVPGMLGHTLYNWALRYARATLVSVTHLAEPVGASLLVFWIFGQRPPDGTIVGGALVLAGIFVVARLEAVRHGQGLSPADAPPAPPPG
jgi:drug/metabolite transporter (DMT)-like permease